MNSYKFGDKTVSFDESLLKTNTSQELKLAPNLYIEITSLYKSPEVAAADIIGNNGKVRSNVYTKLRLYKTKEYRGRSNIRILRPMVITSGSNGVRVPDPGFYDLSFAIMQKNGKNLVLYESEGTTWFFSTGFPRRYPGLKR